MAVIKKFSAVKKIQKHLLGIQNLSIQEANQILDEAKNFIKLNGYDDTARLVISPIKFAR